LEGRSIEVTLWFSQTSQIHDITPSYCLLIGKEQQV
jgi:hypothetical protein